MKHRLQPWVILNRGCPRCGRMIFGGPLSMYDDCPGCGLDFDRGQPGYFTGAMYVSYALEIPLIALVTLIEYLVFRQWSIFRLVLLAWVLTLPLLPWVWQYSRVIWIHFDQWIDPVSDNREEKLPY
jgi:uncharacterized protein (DUF983 family)